MTKLPLYHETAREGRGQVRTGNLADATVRLIAGLALAARSSEIAQKIAALGKPPARDIHEREARVRRPS